MTALSQLWLPILLSTVGVFFASSILHMFVHMLVKAWHRSDYRELSNEDEVAAAIRRGNPAPGMYLLPHCKMEDMDKPETKEKFNQGPVGLLILRANDMPSLGASLGQWFAFCLAVSVFAAYVAASTLALGTDFVQVFRVVCTTAFMAYGFAALPNGIWWGQPWPSVFKHVTDGAVYALIIGLLFAWLWPGA